MNNNMMRSILGCEGEGIIGVLNKHGVTEKNFTNIFNFPND